MDKPGIIPIFVPHLGCPHDCVFCNQKKITGHDDPFDKQQIVDEIERHLETMKGRRYPIEIAFYGGSFTGIETNQQIEYLKIARRYFEDGHIHGIRLSTRPDYINEEIVSRLIEFGVTTIELGVQSLNEKVLVASNRGHSINDVEIAVDCIRSKGLKLGLQMMIGLPEDTLDSAVETARRIISLKPDFVRIYPTVVIKDTELERMYVNNAYEAMDIGTAVAWLSEIMPLFSKANIPIIRIGLQPTEDLTNGKSRVAGAYHPSLRQLAQSEMLLKKLMLLIDDLVETADVSKGLQVTLTAHRKDWTVFRGVKAKNFDAIIEKYDALDFEFVISDDMERGRVFLDVVMNCEKKRAVVKID